MEDTTPMAPVSEPTNDSGRRARKNRGRVGRIVSVLVAVVLVAGAAFGGWYLYDMLGRQATAREKLDDAVQLLRDADEVIVEIDVVAQSTITTDLVEPAQAALDKVPGLQETLDEAVTLIDEARPDLTEAEQVLAQALHESANARVRMADEATVMLEANVKAAAAVGPARAAWVAITESETLTDQAVAKYNLHTKDGVTASTQLSTQAEAKLASAKTLLSEVATGFPEADMAPFVGYCDARLELIAISKKIDSTWLAGKLEDANALLKSYNDKEKAVIELAKALPGTPAAVVSVAYDALAAEATESYFEARALALVADEKVATASEDLQRE